MIRPRSSTRASRSATGSKRAPELLPAEHALELALRALRQVGAVLVEEDDVDALGVPGRGVDHDAADGVAVGSGEPGDRSGGHFEVTHVDGARVQRADDRT